LQPLIGIRVIEFCQIAAGPFAALGEHTEEVLREIAR